MCQYVIPDATVLALDVTFKLVLPCVFKISPICVLDSSDSNIVINRPSHRRSAVSFSWWPEMLNQHLSQRNEPQTQSAAFQELY